MSYNLLCLWICSSFPLIFFFNKLQLWPKALRMTQVYAFTKFTASVFRPFYWLFLLHTYCTVHWGYVSKCVLLTITLSLCKGSIFVNIFGLFLRPVTFALASCHSFKQPLGYILADGSQFVHNQRSEFWGFLFVHQVLSGIKVWGVSWQTFDDVPQA